MAVPRRFHRIPRRFSGATESFGHIPESFRGIAEPFSRIPQSFRGTPERFHPATQSFRGVPRRFLDAPESFGGTAKSSGDTAKSSVHTAKSQERGEKGVPDDEKPPVWRLLSPNSAEKSLLNIVECWNRFPNRRRHLPCRAGLQHSELNVRHLPDEPQIRRMTLHSHPTLLAGRYTLHDCGTQKPAKDRRRTR